MGLGTKQRSEAIDTSLATDLFQKVNEKAKITHLDSKLRPPTNKWFSGMVFGEPQPVFPLPLTFQPSNTGYSISIPMVTSTPKAIFGAHSPDISVSVKDASSYKVSRYDELSTSLTYSKPGTSIGRLTLAEGSPYVFFRAEQATELRIKGYSTIQKVDGGYVLKKDAKTYILSLRDTDVSQNTDASLSLSLHANALVTLGVVPDSSHFEEVFKYTQNELLGTTVDYAIGDNAKTTFMYRTENNQPTLFAAMPHQSIQQPKLPNGSFASIYGAMPVHVGNDFTFQLPLQPASSHLSLQSLTATEKSKLANFVKQDITKTDFAAADSYFAGKALYRAANLYQLAEQLGMKGEASAIKQKIHTELSLWFDADGFKKRSNKYFYYDSSFQGIVGETPSFGSDVFNDHHFHYGYFIYAAAVLAEHDKALVETYKPIVNLLAADIANPRATKEFMQRRAFDPYAGHSWASGDGQFTDGNNQESSSEAVNAWSGLVLWAGVSKNSSLKNQAQWMMSNEAATANAYWVAPDLSGKSFTDYTQPFVSLNWGGKRDYATFFSADPKAILGIQLIPMNPSMTYFAKNKPAILRNLETMSGQGQFSDYLLMYEALLNRDVTTQAEALDEKFIDGANSRSYLMAWLYFHKSKRV